MPQIHAPELASTIRRTYGVRGAQGFDTIAPEIIPVSIVDDLRSDRGLLCRGAKQQAAVAAQFSIVELIGGPNLVVTVLQIIVAVTSTSDIFIMTPAVATAFASAGDRSFCDRRNKGLPGSTIGSRTNVALPVGAAPIQFNVAAGAPVQIPVNYTLSPTDGIPAAGSSRLVIATATVNTTLFCSVEWREEAARPGDNVP